MASVAVLNDSFARVGSPLFNLGPGAHQCWYPVALSEQVPVGKVMGRDFADGRIVIYRGEDGRARATSAYCRHMGADLSFGGDVIGNDIRCPYHHWRYGEGGACSHIPAGDAIPKTANLFEFPIQEQFGLIWIFFGEEPLYELQTFPEYDENIHIVRSYESEHKPLFCEPWVFTTNIYDFVHLKYLHNIDIANSEIEEVDTFRSRMTWNAELGDKAEGGWRPEIYVYGTNSVRTKGDQGGRLKWYIAAGSPLGREGLRFFFTILTTKDEGADAFLDSMAKLHSSIQNEDVDILNNMRQGDFQLVKSDRAMMNFLRKVPKLPYTSMADLEDKARRTNA